MKINKEMVENWKKLYEEYKNIESTLKEGGVYTSKEVKRICNIITNSLLIKEISFGEDKSSLSKEDLKLYWEICRIPEEISDYLSGWKVYQVADEQKEREE